MIRIVDDWLVDFKETKTRALAGAFGDVVQGGATFPGFRESNDVDWGRLCELVGAPKRRGVEAFRIYTADQSQPTFIHTDSAINDWSAVLYFDSIGGTAFWTPKHDNADPFNESEWSLHTLVNARPNRLLVFPSHYWHSRYPRAVVQPGETRLIQVMFF